MNWWISSKAWKGPRSSLTAKTRERLHSLLRWKMIILPTRTISLVHFSLKGWENVLFELGSEQVKAVLHVRRKHKHKPRVNRGDTSTSARRDVLLFLVLEFASSRFARGLCLCLCLSRTCKPAFKAEVPFDQQLVLSDGTEPHQSSKQQSRQTDLSLTVTQSLVSHCLSKGCYHKLAKT